MSHQTLRTLLVEDNPDDAWSAREALTRNGDRFEIQHLRLLSAALDRLSAGPVDVVLLDLGLPDSQGFDTLARVRASSPETPIVLLTGTDDESVAVRALQHGAQDYVVKGAYDRKWLPRIVRYAVERKRAESLARSNADLERLALVASHDLQEPLRKIAAYGGILARQHGEELSPPGRHLLSRMVSASERMAKLVSELLDLSRPAPAAGAMRPVDLNETVSGVLEDLESLIEESEAASIRTDRLPTVWGNPTQMRQLFQNLIANALKFRRPGEPPRVALCGRPLPGDLVEIAVSDNGMGFDPRQAERLFSPFGRPGGGGQAPGNGIGLAICRAIALRHGGWLSAEGGPGRGATFSVVLPLRRTA